MNVLNSNRRSTLATALLCTALLFSGGVASAESNRSAPVDQTEATEVTARFIVRAASVEDAATAVREVGGTVTHELGIIRAVSAMLNATQLRALRENPAIQRISADSNVRPMAL